VWDFIYGSHEYWLSFYDYFLRECNLKCCQPLCGLIDLAMYCGWWSPYKTVAILQHRHSVLNRDNQGRLHCETGPAVQYRDGWGISAWHGTVIPNEWINNHPKAKDLLKHNNIEQRRAGCELVGWDKILQELKTSQIDKDHPEIGTLYEANIPDSGPERFLKVQCGTGRYFVIPVPREMQTAKQANAWTYNIDSNHLPEVRT
jgi:hypothetical protein